MITTRVRLGDGRSRQPEHLNCRPRSSCMKSRRMGSLACNKLLRYNSFLRYSYLIQPKLREIVLVRRRMETFRPFRL
jgi:hypothetical protein